MSEENWVETEEKRKKEVSYETWKDELKKEGEKPRKVLESEKGDGSLSTVMEKAQVKKDESNVSVLKKKKKRHRTSPFTSIEN